MTFWSFGTTSPRIMNFGADFTRSQTVPKNIKTLPKLIGSYFLRYTFKEFEPKWLGYFLSSISLVTGMGIIDSYLGSDELIGKILNILLSTVLIWLSVRLTSQTILFVGSIDLLVNLSFLIYEIFPELGALLYLVIGTLFIFAGLYLNRLREDIKKI